MAIDFSDIAVIEKRKPLSFDDLPEKRKPLSFDDLPEKRKPLSFDDLPKLRPITIPGFVPQQPQPLGEEYVWQQDAIRRDKIRDVEQFTSPNWRSQIPDEADWYLPQKEKEAAVSKWEAGRQARQTNLQQAEQDFMLSEGMSMPPQQLKREIQEQEELVKRGGRPIGLVEGIKRTDWAKKLPFSPAAAAEMIGLYGAMQRVQKADFSYYEKIGVKPEAGRLRDERVISEYIKGVNELSVRGKTFWANVADGVTELPAYMVEFWATGGLASMADDAARKAGEKLFGKYALTKAGQLAMKAGGWGIRGTVRTAQMPHKITAATLEKVIAGEQAGPAFAKTIGGLLISNMSEEAGETLTKILGIDKAKDLLGKSALFKWLKANPSKTVQDFAKVLKSGGYSSLAGELGEEWLDRLMQAVAGTEDFGIKPTGDAVNDLNSRVLAAVKEGIRSFPVEATVLSLPGAAKYTVGKIAAAKEKTVQKAEVGRILDGMARSGPALDRLRAEGRAARDQERQQKAEQNQAEIERMDEEYREIVKGQGIGGAEEQRGKGAPLRPAGYEGQAEGKKEAAIKDFDRNISEAIVTNPQASPSEKKPRTEPESLKAAAKKQNMPETDIRQAEKLKNYKLFDRGESWQKQGYAWKGRFTVVNPHGFVVSEAKTAEKAIKKAFRQLEPDIEKKNLYEERIESGEYDKNDIQAVVSEVLQEKFGWPQKSAKSEAEYFEKDDGKRIRLAQHSVVYPESDVDVFISIGSLPDADIVIPEKADSVKEVKLDVFSAFKGEKWADDAIAKLEGQAEGKKAELQKIISAGGEKTVLAAQKAAKKSNKQFFVYQPKIDTGKVKSIALTDKELHQLMSESLNENAYKMYLQDEFQARSTGDVEAATRAFDNEAQVLFQRGYLYEENNHEWVRVSATDKIKIEKSKEEKAWRMRVSEPKEGDFWTISPDGSVVFGKASKSTGLQKELPKVGPEKEGGTRLYSGIDPGIDKFLSEDVKPAVGKATEAVKYLAGIARAGPKLFMSIVEPAKAAEKYAGKEAYSAVIRGIHKPEAKMMEFGETRLKTIDTNIDELKKWFDRFSKKDQKNFLITFGGKAGSVDAEVIQNEAHRQLPKELREPQVEAAIREIARRNYSYLRSVAGDNVGWVQDYFYGIYENPSLVNKFLKYWKTTKRFTKHKHLPSLADAINYGLEPRHDNYIDNLKAEYIGIARLEAMKWLKDELVRTGTGVYIAGFGDAPLDWEGVNEPVFDDVMLKPELAKLINNLISTNKITRNPVGRFFWRLNNALRIYKFIGSAFHLKVEAKQAVADSGYLGFTHKATAVRGITKGFKKNDPIFKTPEYIDYIELGGGHHYSQESQAQQAMKAAIEKVGRANLLGAATRAVGMPLNIPTDFVNWMFEDYIPKLKYSKYLDFVAEGEKKHGRRLTDWEKINIIKEGQNFYGEMNERLFGRSGTATTAMRYVWLAPGFAEGNYRTILKSLLQWGQKGGWAAGRSRANIPNSALVTAILSTVGTVILTGKWPKKPETLEDIRDLFKIDTGKLDDRDQRIMIDMMDYDKDYWNVYFNLLRGKPDKAVYETLRRMGGMKAPGFEMALDVMKMATGEAIYDWKGDRVTEITDNFGQKLMKIVIHELKRTEPISVSVFKQARRKEVDTAIAFLEAITGVRPTISEKDKREREVLTRIYSLRGQKEELYQYLRTVHRPRQAVEGYNTKVKEILYSKIVPKEFREEWEPKLIIDLERHLQTKAHTASLVATTKDAEQRIERALDELKNFGVTADEAEKLLLDYYRREKTVPKTGPLERHPVIGKALKKRRLKERMETK